MGKKIQELFSSFSATCGDGYTIHQENKAARSTFGVEGDNMEFNLEAAGIEHTHEHTHMMISAKQLLHMFGSTGKCGLRRHWNSERRSREV